MAPLDEVSMKELLIVLNFLKNSNNTVYGKTRFQKLVFLAQKEFHGDYDFNFEAAQFGPLSSKLNHAITRSKKLGLLEETIERAPNGHDQYRYSITDEGLDLVKYGINSKIITTATDASIHKSIDKYSKLRLSQLLDYVHVEYKSYKLE